MPPDADLPIASANNSCARVLALANAQVVFSIGGPATSGFKEGGHKRTAEDREVTFRKPTYVCYACFDSGIVVNGDGAVNGELADYDRLSPTDHHPQGRPVGGVDLALVCTCEAAFPAYENGAVKRAGYRESGGQVRLADDRKAVGVEPPEGLTKRLHDRRLQSWKETEQAMNAARLQAAEGKADATPWFIAEVRNVVQEQACRNRDACRGTGGLQSLGSALSETLLKPGSPLGGAEAADAAVATKVAQLEAAA